MTAREIIEELVNQQDPAYRLVPHRMRFLTKGDRPSRAAPAAGGITSEIGGLDSKMTESCQIPDPWAPES